MKESVFPDNRDIIGSKYLARWCTNEFIKLSVGLKGTASLFIFGRLYMSVDLL